MAQTARRQPRGNLEATVAKNLGSWQCEVTQPVVYGSNMDEESRQGVNEFGSGCAAESDVQTRRRRALVHRAASMCNNRTERNTQALR